MPPKLGGPAQEGGEPSHRRVLMLTSTLPRWPDDSTPRFVLDLAATLAAGATEVKVLAPGFAAASKSERLEGVAIRRFSYALPASLQKLCYDGGMLPNIRSHPGRLALVPIFLASALVAAHRLIRTTRPDIVHAHWILPMGLIAILAAPRDTPVVVTVHGSDALDLKGGVLDRLKSFVLARADHITCNGPRTETAILRLVKAGTKVTRIPMGAMAAAPDARHGLELPAARFKVLFAGRLFRGKGLDDLLQAMASFGQDERPFLLVAGTGPEADRFAQVATGLGIAADVAFLGGLEHRRLLALMGAVDAVVVPTRSHEWVEAQGLVVAEAMFSQVPVIGTTGGGAEDHIRDGDNGLLVPPAAPAALAAALRRLIEQPDLAAALGQAGRRYAREHLTWDACARAFEDVYRSVETGSQRCAQ